MITPLPQDKLRKVFKILGALGAQQAASDHRFRSQARPKRQEREAAQAIEAPLSLPTPDFDGIVCWAQLQERPAANGYRAGNNIDFIITPDLPDYPQEASAPPPASGSAAVAIRARDMDDEIPSEGDEG